MKRLLPLFLLTALCLYSCNSGDVKQNNDIDAGVRQNIRQKNDSLILGLQTGKKNIFKNIATKHFINSIQVQTNTSYRLFRYGVLDENYEVYDEFEVRGRKRNAEIRLENPEKGYVYTYSTSTPDSYLCILQFDFGNDDSGAIAAVYALEDGKWKVDRLDAFMLTSKGKTPAELYELAKKNQEEGNLYDALYYGNKAADLLEKYENSKFKYTEEKRIKLFAKTLQNKIKDAQDLPVTLSDIKTRPVIKDMQTRERDGKLEYYIKYETKIPVDDLGKLSDEYDLVKAEAKKIFKGINFEKSKVEFKASNMEYGYETRSYIFSY